MSEQIIRGACNGCEKFEVVTLDGRGESPALEERGWTLDQDGRHRCPGCPKLNPDQESEDTLAREARLLRVTYEDQPSLGAARDKWKRTHLCLTCMHGMVCRYAPDKSGAEALVTISRCRIYVPPLESL